MMVVDSYFCIFWYFFQDDVGMFFKEFGFYFCKEGVESVLVPLWNSIIYVVI